MGGRWPTGRPAVCETGGVTETGKGQPAVITVAVIGAAGKMGREVVRMVGQSPDFQLVAAIGHRQGVGQDAGEVAGLGAVGVPIEADLNAALRRAHPQVCVDFTSPQAGAEDAEQVLRAGSRLVLGTTGIDRATLARLDRLASTQGLGAIVAANFSLGALLMMQFAAQAARYFADVEIIEGHGVHKKDAPSGTALRTAELIARAREEAATRSDPGSGAGAAAPTPFGTMTADEGRATTPGGAAAMPDAPQAAGEPTPSAASRARGVVVAGVPIHSLRLPGFVAHQEVIWGLPGQTLRIIHDSTDRSSFMPGVSLAIRQVLNVVGLVDLVDLLASGGGPATEVGPAGPGTSGARPL